MPLDDNGKGIAPGSPAAVADGCICDAEKNNHGRGVRRGDGGVIFIFKDACPVHRRSDGLHDLWIVE